MIKLAYCNVENLDLQKAYRLLPQSRKDKVDRFRFMKDKKRSALRKFRRIKINMVFIHPKQNYQSFFICLEIV